MKKAFTIFLICIALFLGYLGVKKVISGKLEEQRIAKVKEGWYVEVITEYINVREKPDQYDGRAIKKIYKGEVYEVLEVNMEDPNHYWFKIKFKDNTTGWVAQNTSGTYLKDVNDTTDRATPIIKFDEDEYHVINYDSIKTNHLNVWDDRDDYEITYIVYHEVEKEKGIDQYWIKWTITDASGKHSSKTQKIVFEQKPDESLVESFNNYTRN